MTEEKLSGFTKAELTENIDWNLEAGVGVYNKTRSGCKGVGVEAGAYHPNGYRKVTINGKVLLIHRIIYFLKNDHCPKYIDHINQIKDDNRIENLRGCTNQENQRNTGIRKDNKSGFKGVSWYKSSNKWRAKITVSGKIIHLGYFNTAKEASEAYEEHAKVEFRDFYREQA